MTHTFEIEEGERQLILLSLGLAARLRPGFHYALANAATTLAGAEMFETFFKCNDNVPPQGSCFDVPPEAAS